MIIKVNQQQSIVNDLYAKDTHKESIKEDAPNNINQITKEKLILDEYRGRNMFYYAFKACKHHINDVKAGRYYKVEGLCGILKKEGKYAFDDYYTTTFFDHYFRHLYTILKFIEQNDWLGEKEQYKYATFVRATLSRYELVLLYYNGFFHPKMKKLMEKYCMLNNLRQELLPICHENICYLQELNINVEDLKNNDFSGSDFEFFLTDKENDCNKYKLSAFYTKEEMSKGLYVFNKWNAYIDNRIKAVQ